MTACGMRRMVWLNNRPAPEEPKKNGTRVWSEGVVIIAGGVRGDRTDETLFLFNRHADGASHGKLATEETGLERVFEESTAIVGGAAMG